MPYTPNPADPTQPVDTVDISTAAAEFRAMKLWHPVPKIIAANLAIVSSTTLANITELVRALEANEEGIFTYELFVGAALATTGIKVAAAIPSGAVLDHLANIISGVPANNFASAIQTSSAIDFTAATQVASSTGWVRGSIWVLNGATPGNLQLQTAQSTSSATALTIRRGSHAKYSRKA